MKVLQLSNKSPYPFKEGGPIAVNSLSNLLLQMNCQVFVLAVNTPKYFVTKEMVADDYKEKIKIDWQFINTNFSVFAATKALIKNKSYHVERFKSKAFDKKLIDLLTQESFDLVILETVYMASYISLIREHSNAKIVLRAHNVEANVWKRVAANLPKGLKKSYLNILANQLQRFENKVLSAVDATWCISEQDCSFFRQNNLSASLLVLPFAMDCPKTIEKRNVLTHNLFSIGSMDWQPNVEGVNWFLRSIFPDIKTKYPQWSYRIAGRNMPKHLSNLQMEGVEVIGEVPNAKDFMLENGVLVVPLLSGSGVRIKIIEALALGKIVLTTTIGLEGIQAQNQKHVLVADTAGEFIEALQQIEQNKVLCEHLSENAMKMAQQYHSFEGVLPILREAIAALQIDKETP